METVLPHRPARTPSRLRTVVSGMALCLFTLLGCVGEPPQEPGESITGGLPTAQRLPAADLERLPNIVLVVVDSLRPDHLAVNGYSRITTPFLEELIKSGTYFRNAFTTAPEAVPAVASLLTAVYPQEHQVFEGVEQHRQRARTAFELNGSEIPLTTLSAETSTLGETLQTLGYDTLAFSNNPEMGEELGLFRGFEEVQPNLTLDAKEMVQRVRQYTDRLEAQSPHFLFLHFSDPQSPYRFRLPWFRNSLDERKKAISAYNSEMSFVDRELRRLHEFLPGGEDTLWIIASSHGEALWDRGRVVGHGHGLHNEEMRSLLLFVGPSLGIPARTVETNVSLVDVAPTVLELLGTAFPQADGLSFLRLLSERPPSGVVQRFRGRPLFAQHTQLRAQGQSQQSYAVLQGPFKLLIDNNGERLFQWVDDPGERNDLLSGQPPAVASDLRRALAIYRPLDDGEGAPEPLSAMEKLEKLLDEPAESSSP